MSYVLAHLSDIHLGPLPAVTTRQLLSKRLTGYINWHRSRAASMAGTALARITSAVAASGADHVAVTGDLTNLALEAEIRAAAIWLEELGDPHDVSVVPGNHDAYVQGALDKAFEAWSPWMAGDDGHAPKRNEAFPYVRRRGPLAIIGLSSAVATPLFVAAGRIEGEQARNLATVLAETGEQGLFRVVLIHHPPVRGATLPRKRLYGIKLFQNAVARHGAELVLHGHTHLAQRHWIGGPAGTRVPVIGVPAAGQGVGGSKPAGAYNLFEIESDGGKWRCHMREWSATTETGPLRLSDERTLWP
ncbi:metallophosphoesterase family protein [Roseitalea porphyridii]|uniref:Metallophosphoesterase n=1 Tax=Roseitalea porphyridii TaxID=1852022 RepID=A0A4P6V2C1_9HYPH|nr:metallophosphoesterase [Roseitalea porphyridii]QBK31607.1 metallophosphoesterase [Roseitalea porphyridii]